jgi:hypothetical protein
MVEHGRITPNASEAGFAVNFIYVVAISLALGVLTLASGSLAKSLCRLSPALLSNYLRTLLGHLLHQFLWRLWGEFPVPVSKKKGGGAKPAL